MKAAVLVFPGSNCDRDLAVAFKAAGAEVEMVWHKDDALSEGVDIVGIPGGLEVRHDQLKELVKAGTIAGQKSTWQALQ